MSFINNPDTIDSFIKNESSAIRFHVLFSVAIVLVGLMLISLTFLLPDMIIKDSEAIKTILVIGGAFVSSLSTLQIKEIIDRKIRINEFTVIKKQLFLCQTSGFLANNERQKIDDLLWKALEKYTIG